jgi:hypothetical protein
MHNRRLFRAQFQDISIVERLGNRQYRVNGARGITYTVDLKGPSCTCEDWKKRKPEGGCKHILAVKLARDEITGFSYSGAQANDSGSHYPRNWDQLARKQKKRDCWTCQICGAEGGPYGPANLHAHHIQPKSRGGSDESSNLITLCKSCHEDIHGYSIPSGSNRDIYNNDPRRTGTRSQRSSGHIESWNGSKTAQQPGTRATREQSEIHSQRVDPAFESHAIPLWSQSHPENSETCQLPINASDPEPTRNNSASTVSETDPVESSDQQKSSSHSRADTSNTDTDATSSSGNGQNAIIRSLKIAGYIVILAGAAASFFWIATIVM